MLQLFPKYPADHASMDKVLESRKLAWQLLCAVSGFSASSKNKADMHAPIEQPVLEAALDDKEVAAPGATEQTRR